MKVVNTGESTTLLGRISRKSGETREDGHRPRHGESHRVEGEASKSLVEKAHRITVKASFIGLSPVCGGGRDATS